MFDAGGKPTEREEAAIDRGYRLLVVDDSEIIHEAMDAVMPDYFLSIVHAESGEEGLEIFIEEKPDCVLMDINMRRDCWSGFQAVNKFRKYEKQNGIYVPTPGRSVIIMHSTEPRGLYLEAALASGANDYVEKGTAPDVMHDTFLKYLNK